MEPVAVLVVGAVRVLGSLPVLRWPLPGAVLAIALDVADLVLLSLLTPTFGPADYQPFDKWADQVYLALFLVVALRWTGVERTIAIGLYAFRLVGFIAFELTGERGLLIAFPNVFELWFLIVAAVHARGARPSWGPIQGAGILAVATAAKLLQEWALHGARLFDELSSLEVLEQAWRWITGR